MSNSIGVVYDGKNMSGNFMYRVNYGSFAIPIESSKELTIDEATAIGDEQVAASQSHVPPPLPFDPVAGQPQRFDKLQIRRAMQRLGIEAQLDALLDASAVFKKEWLDAPYIVLSDLTTTAALAQASIDVDAVVAEYNRAQ